MKPLALLVALASFVTLSGDADAGRHRRAPRPGHENVDDAIRDYKSQSENPALGRGCRNCIKYKLARARSHKAQDGLGDRALGVFTGTDPDTELGGDRATRAPRAIHLELLDEEKAGGDLVAMRIRFHRPDGDVDQAEEHLLRVVPLAPGAPPTQLRTFAAGGVSVQRVPGRGVSNPALPGYEDLPPGATLPDPPPGQ